MQHKWNEDVINEDTKLKTEINVKWLHLCFPDMVQCVHIFHHCFTFRWRRCSSAMEALKWTRDAA